MKVFRKRPDEPWEVAIIPNTLEALQKEVGGYIECVALDEETILICNEEGRIKHLPVNQLGCGAYYGTLLMVGVDGDEFCDITPAAEAFARFDNDMRARGVTCLADMFEEDTGDDAD